MKLATSLVPEKELIITAGAGNPGALSLAMRTAQQGRRDILERLYDLGLSGPQLWLLYKDLGDETLPTFFQNVESEDVKAKLAALGY